MNFCILLLICIMFFNCSKSSMSPEDVVKKAVEAIHNNDMNEVKHYFDFKTWYEVMQTKELIEGNKPILPDKVEILKSTYKDLNASEHCFVLTNTTCRSGETEKMEYNLEKGSGDKWRITVISNHDFINERN